MSPYCRLPGAPSSYFGTVLLIAMPFLISIIAIVVFACCCHRQKMAALRTRQQQQEERRPLASEGAQGKLLGMEAASNRSLRPCEINNDPYETAAPVAVAVSAVDTGDAAGASEEGMACVVCMDARKNVLLEQCRHVCVCAGCAESLQRAGPRRNVVVCPLCRTSNKSWQIVFL